MGCRSELSVKFEQYHGKKRFFFRFLQCTASREWSAVPCHVLRVEISVVIKSQDRKNGCQQCVYLYRMPKNSMKREGTAPLPQAMSSCWLSLHAAWPGCPMQRWHAELHLWWRGDQECSRRIQQPHTERLTRDGVMSCAYIQLCFLFLSRFLTSFFWLFTGYLLQISFKRVYLYPPCH